MALSNELKKRLEMILGDVVVSATATRATVGNSTLVAELISSIESGGGGGSGTVTQVDVGTGLTGGPITDSGTIEFDADYVNMSDRILVDSNSSNVLDWENRHLIGGSGNTSADWENRQLYEPSGISTLDWGAANLLDLAGELAVDWNDRSLRSSDAFTSVDWQNRRLFDNSGNTLSLDYDNRIASDSAGENSINYEARVLSNGDGSDAMHWGDRQLNDSVGGTSIEWDEALTVHKHIVSVQADTTTVAPDAGAGVGGTVSLERATDVKGHVVLTTGTGSSAASPAVQVTFANPYQSIPIVVLTACNDNAQGSGYFVESTVNGFSITAAPGDSLETRWNYMVME